MAGQVKQLIERYIHQRTRGDPAQRHFVRAHLLIKGINPDKYTETTADDPTVLAQLNQMLRDFQN